MIPSFFGNTALGWVATIVSVAAVFALVMFLSVPVGWALDWVGAP